MKNANAIYSGTTLDYTAPKVAVLVFFASDGGKVWLQDHGPALFKITANTPPADRQATQILGMQPTIVGTNWAEFGNDEQITAAATDAGGKQQ
jgi:hypothetical protein